MNKRRTDTEFVTDAQLAAKRDQIAEEWATEYSREGSPWYREVIKMAARCTTETAPTMTYTINRLYEEGTK